MIHAEAQILALLNSDAAIRKKDILAWMNVGDLPTRAAVCDLTGNAWNRIQPSLSRDEQCGFMKRYLLECLETNPNSEDYEHELVHSGFEAAAELAAWVKHLARMPEGEDVVAVIVEDLTALYLRSDARTRNRIETGALEHILEYAPLVPRFAFWRDNPELKDAFEACLAWGEAHQEN